MNEAQILFIERVRRYLRLVELKAPDVVIERETKLIEKSLSEISVPDLAHAIGGYTAVAAKMTEIERDIDSKYPIYPEDK